MPWSMPVGTATWCSAGWIPCPGDPPLGSGRGGGEMIGAPREPRSYLAGIIPQRMDPETEKRNGWRDQGILVVSADDPRLGWPEREMIQHLAKKLFGEHQGKEKSHA
jgi:hypothetical protein